MLKDNQVNFISKVYSLLAATIIFTACISYFTASSLTAMEFTSNNTILLIGLFIGSAIGCFFLKKNVKLSLLMLAIFSGANGLLSSKIMLKYSVESINQSLIITAIVFIGLSMYVLKTKKDFSFMGGFLFIALIIVFCSSMAMIFFDHSLIENIISGAAILIFSGYILYDTSQIVKKDYGLVEAVINLYLDITIIFQNILDLGEK